MKDYDKITFVAEYILNGVRSDEKKWAEKAWLQVYNHYADVMNSWGINLYNRLWHLRHPKVGKLEGKWMVRYNAGYERFTAPIREIMARKYGVSPNGKRIVRLIGAIDSMELNADMTHGIFYGTVRDLK